MPVSFCGRWHFEDFTELFPGVILPVKAIKIHSQMLHQAYIAKAENLYCAFSPELKTVAYGSCREEVLNELQEEASRQNIERNGGRGYDER